MSDVQPMSNLNLEQTVHPHKGNHISDSRASMPSPHSAEIPARSVEPQHDSPRQTSPERAPGNGEDGSSSDVSPDQALEAALQEATAQADVQSDGGSTSDVDMMDSFAPDPEVLAPTSAESPTPSSQQDNGLLESSEEPMDVADGDSDAYEPPEATPPPVDALSSADSPPFSPAPPEAIPRSSRTDKQHDGVTIGLDEATASKATTHADDIALPPAQADQVFPSTPDVCIVGCLTDEQNSSSLASRKTFFTLYESPLKNFRAFRFHPNFEQEVQGGFKSITYSNNIADDKELCRYELAGGVCNDASCEFQHFRDMGLAGASVSARGISYL
jgi:hypothetical protein